MLIYSTRFALGADVPRESCHRILNISRGMNPALKPLDIWRGSCIYACHRPWGQFDGRRQLMAAKKKATKKLKKVKSLQHTKPLMALDKGAR
jgi:hypothetical protein